MAILRKVDLTMKKFFFSLAEIETKFIVESVCQKTYEKNPFKSNITFSDNKTSKK